MGRINQIENEVKVNEEEQAVTPTVKNLNKLENLKTGNEKEFEYIIRGAIVSSRVNQHEKCEKINKCFLNLENNNNNKSTIPKLELKDGITITTNRKVIMNMLHSFYSELYSSR